MMRNNVMSVVVFMEQPMGQQLKEIRDHDESDNVARVHREACERDHARFNARHTRQGYM